MENFLFDFCFVYSWAVFFFRTNSEYWFKEHMPWLFSHWSCSAHLEVFFHFSSCLDFLDSALLRVAFVCWFAFGLLCVKLHKSFFVVLALGREGGCFFCHRLVWVCGFLQVFISVFFVFVWTDVYQYCVAMFFCFCLCIVSFGSVHIYTCSLDLVFVWAVYRGRCLQVLTCFAVVFVFCSFDHLCLFCFSFSLT